MAKLCKAQREHTCAGCKKVILRGNSYWHMTASDPRSRYHPWCVPAGWNMPTPGGAR